MNLNEAPYFDKESRQDVMNARTYRESRTNAVVQLSAVEPDGHALRWELTGSDASDFMIVDADDLNDGKDRRQLIFKSKPDYETPKGANGNMYEVTVRATEMTAVGDGPKKSTKIDVMVSVENVNEPGMVGLSWLQPEVGTVLTATVSDPDTEGDVQAAQGQTDGVEYTWYRSKVTNPNRNPGTTEAALAGEWEKIEAEWNEPSPDPVSQLTACQIETDNVAANEFYTPQGDCAPTTAKENTLLGQSDEGKYLLVRAVYKDDSAVEDDDTPDESATTTAIGISAYSVRGDVSRNDNNSPDFNASETTRSIPESTAVGMAVGLPVDVDRNEDDDTLTYEIVKVRRTTPNRCYQ